MDRQLIQQWIWPIGWISNLYQHRIYWSLYTQKNFCSSWYWIFLKRRGGTKQIWRNALPNFPFILLNCYLYHFELYLKFVVFSGSFMLHFFFYLKKINKNKNKMKLYNFQHFFFLEFQGSNLIGIIKKKKKKN